MTQLETILTAMLVAETAVAIGAIAAIRPSQKAFAHLNELTEGVKKELLGVKRENRELLEQIGELKTLVAVLIAESGTGGAERQRIVQSAKARIASGKGSLELIKEGKLMQALNALMHEVGADSHDEVIQLTGKLAGIVKAMEAGRLSNEYYEQELSRIRGAAIGLAFDARADGRA